MRILLVEPAKAPATIGGEDIFLFESLGLEYLAAGVGGEHEVRILDLRLEDGFQEALEDFRPDLVGITAYTSHVNPVRALFEQAKRWNAAVLTVVGGHHATVMPEDFLSPHIDLVVVGEGVFAFREIVDRRARAASYEGIPGVARPVDGRLVPGPDAEQPDLDAFPFPDRQLTAKYRRHYYSEWMKPLASIRTSKGCSHRCSFCSLWKLTEGRYLVRSPESIVRELAAIEEEAVFFADDESLLDSERMLRLAALIKEAGIRKQYFLYGRSDTIAENPGLIAAWREIGLARVFVGLEFFRDEDLRYIRKGSTCDDNQRAVEILHEHGIEVYASFILRPEFDQGDFAALRDYCRRLGLGFASFAVLTPLPGTDLYDLEKDGLITRNYDHVDFLHTLLPTKLPLEEFYEQFYRLLVRAIPLRKQLAFLWRYPLREIPSTLLKGYRIFNRVRRAHLDYAPR